MKELIALVVIGGVMGILSLIIRGITSVRGALIEWISSVTVAVVVGWAIKDYILSEGLYNACVATGSFFGIYIVRGGQKVMQEFSADPYGVFRRLNGKRHNEDK